MDLTKVPLEELLKEVSRRKETGETQSLETCIECNLIKSLNIKGLTAADVVVEYYIDKPVEYDNGGPSFQFYFKLKGKDKLQDFYYGDHGLDYEEWQPFIPPNFAEAMENCYEYHGPGYVKGVYGFIEKLPPEKYQEALQSTLNGAFETLRKCGYTKFNQIKSPN